MKICAISDTHSFHRKIEMPEADILVVTGDLTFQGELEIIEDFSKWIKELSYKHKIVIFGNHELGFHKGFKREPALEMMKDSGAHYLENSGMEIEGVKFWGSPVTPWFYDWEWNYHRGEEIAAVWKQIPLDTNILLTHGPAYGILDMTRYENKVNYVGCKDLLEKIWELPNLKAHCFGHVHPGYGIQEIANCLFVNGAICNSKYKPVNKPIVFEVEKK